MTHANRIGVAILLSTFLVSHPGFAASCYEKSPNYDLLGDKYFDLDNSTPLTASDKKILDSSLRKIVGNWKGIGSTFECVGPELDPVAENNKFTLSAKISTNSSNELHVDVEKQLLVDKSKSNDHLFFFGANSYRTISITPNKIILVESFRQVRIKNRSEKDPNKKAREKFRPFYELIHTIEHSGTHFDYNLRRYINGSLAIEERWQLVR